MISFKYGLILLRYSPIDSVLFLPPLLSYSKQLLLQKLPTLTGLWIGLGHFESDSVTAITKNQNKN